MLRSHSDTKDSPPGEAYCELYCSRDSSGDVCPISKNLQTLERGQRLWSAPSETEQIWLVASGMVATCIDFEDGRRQIVDFEMIGDLAGSGVADERDGVWIEAMKDTRLCRISLTAENQ